MEACFVTSNSFTKTVELVPSPTPKARMLTHPKRIPDQFRYSKTRVPSVSCCHVESSWSSIGDDNDKKPIMGADWRRFRARLVAGEETWKKQPAIDHDDHPPPPQISIGEKWAHPLHEPEKGCLLIATEKLDGVHIFERTVVLLLSTGPVGPSGIILNRPSLMSIKEARSTVLDVEGTFSERPLFFGGPLEEGVFLVSGDDGVFEEVMKGLWYGRKESVGCAAEMVKRNVVGIEDFSFFDGYCGWDKEQLREEIRAGYWKVAACSPSVIGSTCLQSVGLWDEILCLMAPRKEDPVNSELRGRDRKVGAYCTRLTTSLWEKNLRTQSLAKTVMDSLPYKQGRLMRGKRVPCRHPKIIVREKDRLNVPTKRSNWVYAI